MAFVLRRWRVLLVLNVVAVAGFMTLWTKCTHTRVAKTIGQDDVKRQSRSNGTAQGLSISHEVLLKRLGSLEDVVYRQLNGLSKSLGLIEGFGGRGKGGFPATLASKEEADAKVLREKYGYNAYLSQKISLDRSIPDFRPSKCKKASFPRDLPNISLIFIFVNEALSVILRSVHSAVNHTPAHLLKEIILVDDYSDDEQLKGPLEDYVNKRYPGMVKIVRNQKREGLIRARIEGWKAASSEVTGFFDAHVEFTPSWAEPVLTRIKEDHKRIILPSIDNIKHETFELERYENSGHGYNWELWCMYINPPKQWWDDGDTSAPIRTPAMIGCSFVVNREYFGHLGLLDSGMDVYGGENIELGIKVWLCGGSMEVLPCSRVAHIARMKKPYHSNIASSTRRNALRVAEVWMDQFKSQVYLAWNIPMECTTFDQSPMVLALRATWNSVQRTIIVSLRDQDGSRGYFGVPFGKQSVINHSLFQNHGIDYGDISQRVALRKSLHCKNFEWYLDNVYPEMRRYNNTLFYGEIRSSKATHLCMDQGEKVNHTATLHPCHGMGPQLGRYTKEGHFFLGALGSTGDETRCLMDDQVSNFPQLLNCDKVSNTRLTTWHFSQNESIINRATGRCLEVIQANAYFGHSLVLQTCSGQKWNIKNTMKQ